MTSKLLSTKQDLETQLTILQEEEKRINLELEDHFSALVGKTVNNKALKIGGVLATNASWSNNSASIFESSNFEQDLNKVAAFAPVYETVVQNAKKLSTQIEECYVLSERLSSMVRKLDTKQMRAKRALAVTEDILSLKDCKFKLMTAIEEENLSAAVGYLRQVHEIDEVAAKTSDDYDIIMEKEQIVKEMVRSAFQQAITESNTNAVMALCPLLQTLGLETEARDNFLEFMEQKVFVAVSADASAVEGATDPSTGYAQALSTVFNSTYLIIQQYLPMVIQGLENSLGDVHFLRRLHKRCETQASLVLKRYIKWREIRERIDNLKSVTPNHSMQSQQKVNQAELHMVLDELALLVQYCCRYVKYLKHVCKGAESKIRQKESSGHNHNIKDNNGNNGPIVVFAGNELDFDRVIDEMVARYYLVGEQWLVKLGVHHCLPHRLDESFFVLQKCGLRAIATNHFQTANAVMNFIADLITSDMVQQATDQLHAAIQRIVQSTTEHMSRFKKNIVAVDNSNASSSSSSSLYSRNLFAGALLGIGGGSGSSGGAAQDAATTQDLILHDEGYFTLPPVALASLLSLSTASILQDDQDNRFGVASSVEMFNSVELCMRYCDRLGKDLFASAQSVFGSDSIGSINHTHKASSSSSSASSSVTHASSSGSENEKLKMCKENFERARVAFQNTLRQGYERLITAIQPFVREILHLTLSGHIPSTSLRSIYGGIHFDERDPLAFEAQSALTLFPKLLTLPLETTVRILTTGLSETSRDVLIGQLADMCCEQIEQFVHTTTFALPGALKLEEFVRVLSALFARHSSTPVRGKFARLREIMSVLTLAEVPSATSSSEELLALQDSYAHLSAPEAEAILMMRVDR